MSQERNLGRAIRMLAQRAQPSTFAVWGTVVSVDKTENTCVITPLDDSADITALLMAAEGVGSINYPKVGSLVVAVKINETLAAVVLFSELDSVELNGNFYEGIPIVAKLAEKLNNLETAFNSHVHILAISGGNTGTAAPPANQLIPTQKTEIENNTVMHGNGT